jgi:hypothetical protein
MWQPHQFVRHLAEPQLKVSVFIYILILAHLFLDLDSICLVKRPVFGSTIKYGRKTIF